MGVWPVIAGIILGIVALFIYPLWCSMSFPPFLGFLKTVPAFFGLIAAILFPTGYVWNEILNGQKIAQGGGSVFTSSFTQSGPHPPPQQQVGVRPTTMYHGTPHLEWAKDI